MTYAEKSFNLRKINLKSRGRQMAVKDISDTIFDTEVINSSTPVLVDFWAEWCGPCKALSPILDELEQEIGAKVKVVKVNIDKYQSIASTYGVRSIPTLLVFDKGKAISTKVGGMPKTKLVEWMTQLGFL